MARHSPIARRPHGRSFRWAAAAWAVVMAAGGCTGATTAPPAGQAPLVEHDTSAEAKASWLGDPSDVLLRLERAEQGGAQTMLPRTFGSLRLTSVTTQAQGSALDDAATELMQELELVLADRSSGEASPNEPFDVAASVVELSSVAEGERRIASCVVSAAVSHPDRGLIATLRGTATAEDRIDSAERAERTALAAAAESAASGIDSVLAVSNAHD